MNFIGVDLHKKTVSLCVMVIVDGKRKVATRRRFDCRDTPGIRDFFEGQKPFQVVVEATSNYEWFLQLVEDLADRWVLAHPKKLRVIAESTAIENHQGGFEASALGHDRDRVAAGYQAPTLEEDV